VTKIPNKQLKEGKIYFDSWFQKFQLLVIDTIDSGPDVRENITAIHVEEEAVHLMVDRKLSDKKPGPKSDLQRHTPDLPPPPRPNLLKLTEHPKILPPVGDQVLNTQSSERIPHIQSIRHNHAYTGD
jgi:hypothetical protein